MALTAFRKVQIGLESTSGTAVAADKRVYGTFTVTPNDEKHTPTDEDGRLSSFRRIATVKKATSAVFSGDVDFETLVDWLSMCMKGSITPVQQGATAAYLWTFVPSIVAANAQDTYTFEYGDEQQVFEFDFGFVQSIVISWEEGQVAQLTVNLMGRDLTKVSFTSVSDNALVEELVASNLKVYIDGLYANLGSTQKTALVPRGSVTINSGLVPVWYADGSLEFSVIKENKRSMEIQMDLVMEADGITEYDAWKADTLRAVRLEFTGIEIATPYDYLLTIDMIGHYISEPTLYSDSDGVNIISMTLQSHRDASDNEYEVGVINQQTAI